MIIHCHKCGSAIEIDPHAERCPQCSKATLVLKNDVKLSEGLFIAHGAYQRTKDPLGNTFWTRNGAGVDGRVRFDALENYYRIATAGKSCGCAADEAIGHA